MKLQCLPPMSLATHSETRILVEILTCCLLQDPWQGCLIQRHLQLACTQHPPGLPCNVTRKKRMPSALGTCHKFIIKNDTCKTDLWKPKLENHHELIYSKCQYSCWVCWTGTWTKLAIMSTKWNQQKSLQFALSMYLVSRWPLRNLIPSFDDPFFCVWLLNLEAELEAPVVSCTWKNKSADLWKQFWSE